MKHAAHGHFLARKHYSVFYKFQVFEKGDRNADTIE
jgi:hypothetical protein